MEIGSLLLILTTLLLVGAYLYAPFTQRARRLRTYDSHDISSLKAERDRIVNALQELDFDHNLGKIPAEDYPEQRAALLKKGAEALRNLDELTHGASASTAESRIEKAAEAARADSSVTKEQPANEDEDLEAMLAARRKQRKEKSVGFCPKCGKAILISDKFCPSCGKSIGN